VTHTLRLDYSGLKRRLSGVSPPSRQTAVPAFVELMSAAGVQTSEYVIKFESGPSPLSGLTLCTLRLDNIGSPQSSSSEGI